ncbi:MAG: 1-acyl-sn-glycerol-3-phosphate acyltransferase [Alphaproteobacteria bacterium]|jgi:1-acyl-sn-glycerol-3-phosphate acyltransferase|nr:1-acyl-sn-glycerol-3-phosphate acyltransferase [Alphaproteobacteria bacterium]MBT4018427.1 1-acyl-sn-glycerol-3-phosphate acyltransferase [Alphaproteobacteria bacterium]MBT4965345.1 1-acyl-sn-glycerol-3-phosphate acyltransferase [Alphaproteobacteria bacterium]MBT5159217.1 1-acyl-sn-glycerol-3-phosphate acyltransferase [Alphaproteobacteria bacterium]MBT5919716.1 1-acyl-sn-glycerol-3-phosphate acyltransferase [Alphaproteobacteria bacterium]
MRALIFQILFTLWTIFMLVFFAFVVLVPRVWVTRVQKWWGIGVMLMLRVLLNIRYEIRGQENLPEGACVVASKHQSIWDTIIWHIILEDPAMVMKKELLSIPIYGWFAIKAKMIPVDRKAGASALKTMLRAADEASSMGRPILIFPEGTRTPVGERGTYQPGVTALYRHLKLPAIPVAVNSGLFWSKEGLSKDGGTIVLEYGPAIPAGLAKKEFMAELESRIENATDRLMAEHTGKA